MQLWTIVTSTTNGQCLVVMRREEVRQQAKLAFEANEQATL